MQKIIDKKLKEFDKKFNYPFILDDFTLNVDVKNFLKQSLQQAIREALESVRLEEKSTSEVYAKFSPSPSSRGHLEQELIRTLGYNQAVKELDNKIDKWVQKVKR